MRNMNTKNKKTTKCFKKSINLYKKKSNLSGMVFEFDKLDLYDLIYKNNH